jgi:hypothetical protein
VATVDMYHFIYVSKYKTVNADYNAELFGKIKIYRAFEIQLSTFSYIRGGEMCSFRVH